MTGVLAPSNTPADKVVWIPLHGLQTMTGHDPRAATDISAVLIQLRAPSAGFMLDLMYNKQGNRLTFAYPIGAIMADLFQRIGWFDKVLALVAYLVALVSAAGVLVAIYNSMAARRATSPSCGPWAPDGASSSPPSSSRRRPSALSAWSSPSSSTSRSCPRWRRSSGRRRQWS